MLTPIGKALRKARIDHGVLLKEMADEIGVSPSYLSSIETGRKAVTPDFMKRIESWGRFSLVELEEIKRAADSTIKHVKVSIPPHMPVHEREALALLARFDDLPPERQQKIINALKEAK